MTDMSENLNFPEEKKEYMPDIPESISTYVDYRQGKDGKEYARLQEDGKEAAITEWDKFRRTVGFNASYDELKNASKEYRARASQIEEKTHKDYAMLISASIEARIQVLENVRIEEQLASPFSPWKEAREKVEAKTSTKNKKYSASTVQIRQIKKKIEDAIDQQDINPSTRDYLKVRREMEIAEAVKQAGSFKDVNVDEILANDKIETYLQELSQIGDIDADHLPDAPNEEWGSQTGDYANTINNDSRYQRNTNNTPSTETEADNTKFAETKDSMETTTNADDTEELRMESKKDKKKLSRRQKLTAAFGTVVSVVAVSALLHGARYLGKTQPVESKSRSAGTPTVTAQLPSPTPYVSPTIEAATQTETPTEIIIPTETAPQTATQTETLEPTTMPSPTNTDTSTETLTGEPTFTPSSTSTESPTPTPEQVQDNGQIQNVSFSEASVLPNYSLEAAYIINESFNPNYGGALSENETATTVQELADSEIYKAFIVYGGTRDLAQQAMTDLLASKSQDGSPTEALKKVKINYGPGYDYLLDNLRSQSKGTTPITVLPDGKVTFETISFSQQDVVNNQVNPEIAAEELLQMAQYEMVVASLFNDKYLSSVAGISTPEQLAHEINSGHLRAFLEQGQQVRKREFNVGYDSYKFGNEQDTNLTAPEAHAQFVDFIKDWTDEDFTVDDYFDAERIRQINDDFRESYRQKTGLEPNNNINIWNYVSMRRSGQQDTITPQNDNFILAINNPPVLVAQNS